MLEEQKFNLETDESGTLDFLLLQSENRLEITYAISDEEKSITLTLDAYCTLLINVPYRITFFVNHSFVKFNGDYDCLDLKVEGGI